MLGKWKYNINLKCDYKFIFLKNAFYLLSFIKQDGVESINSMKKTKIPQFKTILNTILNYSIFTKVFHSLPPAISRRFIMECANSIRKIRNMTSILNMIVDIFNVSFIEIKAQKKKKTRKA